MVLQYAGTSAAASGDTYITLPQAVTEYAPTTPIAGSDSATGADAVTTLDAALTPTDSGSGADTSSLTAVLATVTDTATGVDVATVSVPISVTDTGAGADASALAAAYTVTDSGVGADSVPSMAKAVTDAAVGADTAPALGKTVTDSGTGADVSALSVSVVATDTGSGADASVLAAVLVATDVGSGVDSVPSLAKAVTDAASAVDTSSVSVGAEDKVGSDSAVASDASALTAAQSAAETATASDTASVATGAADSNVRGRVGELTLTGATGDTFNITGLTSGDRVTLLVAFQPQEAAVLVVVTDAGVASDTAALTAVRTVTDSGSGADASALTATLVTTDAGSGADSVPALAKAVADSATTVDAVIAVAKAVTDAATGVDAVTTLDAGASNTVSDTGTASDVAVLTAAAFLVSDAAVAVDSAVVLIAPSTGTITSPFPSLIQAISAASLAPVQDLFNRVNGAIGISDTGHTWITQSGVWSISSNRAVRSDTAGLVQATVVIDSGMTTCSLSVDAVFFPGLQDAGVVFAGIDDDNYLLFAFQTTAGPISELRLWKRDASTFTLLAGPHTVSSYANTTKPVRVEWDATTGAIELWFGGTLIAAPTLSSGDRTKYAAGTRQGLREFSASPAEKTFFDNYNLVDELLPAATVSNTLPVLSTLVTARHANTTDWSDPASDTTFSGVGTQVVVVTAGV